MNCLIISNGMELCLKGNEYEQPMLTFMAELKNVLEILYHKGYTKFYLITAKWGISLLAGELLLLMKKTHADISIHVVVSYEEEAKNWSESQRDRYYRLHRLADEVIMTSKQQTSKSEMNAVRYALKHSDLLYVFGKPKDNLDTVKVAEKMGVSVTYITDN